MVYVLFRTYKKRKLSKGMARGKINLKALTDSATSWTEANGPKVCCVRERKCRRSVYSTHDSAQPLVNKENNPIIE